MEPEISGGNLATLSHVCFLLLSPYGNDRAEAFKNMSFFTLKTGIIHYKSILNLSIKLH